MTYTYTGLRLAKTTFADIFVREVAAMAAAVLAVPAIIFKLNFTQADAPELVQGIGKQIRDWTEPFDLVLQARLVFVLLAMTSVMVVVLFVGLKRSSVTGGSYEPGNYVCSSLKIDTLTRPQILSMTCLTGCTTF